MRNDELKDLLETIDAAMFTGDTFHDEKTLELFEYYLNRFNREIKNIKENDFYK